MNRKFSLNGIQQTAFLVICVWIIVPSVNLSSMARVAVFAAAMVWVLCEVAQNPRCVSNPPPSSVCLILFMTILVLTEWLNGGWSTLRPHIQFLIGLIVAIFGVQMQAKNQWNLRWTIIGILAMVCFVAATTINKLQADKWAARAVVRNSERAGELMAENIGGYLLTYLASALCPLLLYVVLRKKSVDSNTKFFRIVTAVVFLVCFVFVMRASYFLALLSCIGGCLIVIAPKGRPEFLLFIILASSVLCAGNEEIFRSLKSATKQTPLHDKIVSLEGFFQTGDAGRASGRQERYNRSIRLFLESPVIGQTSRRDVGKHSTLLDTFAEFGLIGGFLFCFGLFEPIYRLYKQATPTQKKCIVALSFCLIVHMGLNNLFAGSTLVVYVMMPFGLAFVEDPTLRLDHYTGHQL